MEYLFRKSVLENEQKFILLEDKMRVIDLQTNVVRNFAYRDMSAVELRYFAKRHIPDAYLCEIVLQSGALIYLNNQHYQGIASFENRSASYTPFEKALHAKFASQSCNFTKGINPIAYWNSMIFFNFFALMIGIVSLAALIPYGILTLLGIAYLFYRLRIYFNRNKAGTYDPLHIPEVSLP